MNYNNSRTYKEKVNDVLRKIDEAKVDHNFSKTSSWKNDVIKENNDEMNKWRQSYNKKDFEKQSFTNTTIADKMSINEPSWANNDSKSKTSQLLIFDNNDNTTLSDAFNSKNIAEMLDNRRKNYSIPEKKSKTKEELIAIRKAMLKPKTLTNKDNTKNKNFIIEKNINNSWKADINTKLPNANLMDRLAQGKQV